MTATKTCITSVSYGELRGLLEAFAWANEKCNHSCTFTVEELSPGTDVREIMTKHFGGYASSVAVTELGDWAAEIGKTLQH